MAFVKNLFNTLDNFLPQFILDKLGSDQAKVVSRLGATVLAAFAIKQLYKAYRIRLNNQKRERKRANKDSSIKKIREKCKYVKPEEVERIIRLSLNELRDAIKSGKLKPSQVLTAYQAKSLQAHDKTNCIVEYITEAEGLAEVADHSDGEGKRLHGIPVSIKDDVPIIGYDTSMGVIDRCELPNEIHCTLLQLLLKEGAIPFCRTNIPQFELAYEVSNPIFGETCNPHDTKRGSGGSSGGESSLIASGGSILGIGSDIGGSIRNPCHLTGLCGFKCTPERHSTYGHDVFAGEPDVFYENVLKPAWGPMARDVESVILTSKILLDGRAANDIDPLMAPLPFNEEVFNDTKPLRIGFYIDNGLLTTVPAVKRAVRQAKDYLESRGHTLVEWLPPDIEAIVDLEYEALFANGGEKFFATLAHEKQDDCVEYFFRGKSLPQWLRPLYAKLVALKDPKCAKIIKEKYHRTTEKYWEMCAKFRQSRRKVTEEWRKMNLDALICPAGAFPAPPMKSADLLLCSLDVNLNLGGGSKSLNAQVAVCNFIMTDRKFHRHNVADSYLMLYNIINYPGGVVRMTSVTEQDNNLMKNYPDHDMYHRRVKEAMKGSVGLPVGVQVVSPCYEDEMCLRVMKEVEGAADFHIMNK